MALERPDSDSHKMRSGTVALRTMSWEVGGTSWKRHPQLACSQKASCPWSSLVGPDGIA